MKAEVQKPGSTTPSAKASKSIDWERLTEVLSAVAAVKYAMVFGSARDGVVRAGSDLDVAVGLTDAEAGNVDCLLDIVGRVEDAFGVTCDPAVLNTAGPVLRHEALKGRILFVRPDCENAFSGFYVRTCAEYEDLMVSYARQLAYRGYGRPATGS